MRGTFSPKTITAQLYKCFCGLRSLIFFVPTLFLNIDNNFSISENCVFGGLNGSLHCQSKSYFTCILSCLKDQLVNFD